MRSAHGNKSRASKSRADLSGLRAHCRYPRHAIVLKGIPNKIKVIERMAYGFRGDEDFFLNIHAAFPGMG
jgi:transposase